MSATRHVPAASSTGLQVTNSKREFDLTERVSMSERLWGVNVGVNEIFVFSFLSCDYPLQRGGCHLLVTAKSWYEKNKISIY